MRSSLRAWIADADTRHSVAMFGLPETLAVVAYQDGRLLDLYTSLVGELFDLLRAENVEDPRDWATVANGLSLVGSELQGHTQSDAFFFSSAAYYLGGLSASAYLTMRRANPGHWEIDSFRACYDLLARPFQIQSEVVSSLLSGLAEGTADEISGVALVAAAAADAALQLGPEQWVSARVLRSLIGSFGRRNVRTVLPDGDAQLWTPLVGSFLSRRPPVWDFFPSQIEAIKAGLLGSNKTFSIQMPTGAGKTALTETLIYGHLIERPGDLAVLLVPYRSLARELRASLGKRLDDVGFPSRTVYGGTVPTPEETQNLDAVRAIIATPEAMAGLIGSAPAIIERISLVVCDEGHLLDSTGRGVGLELLLARFRARADAAPRMVFVSAVVPNIDEINAWLGGDDDTVVRSDFQPAGADYAVLRPTGGAGRQRHLALEMRAPTATNLPTRTLPDFLSARDFEYLNPATGRRNTYTFESFKTQAIAAARRALPLGTVAVFARTKTGTQGVISLAGELASQLQHDLPLPRPVDHTTDPDRLGEISQYLTTEYGTAWVGTAALAAGAVVHHGDIPQETREVLEEVLVAEKVRMVLCTSTLAEGVNLPIRTLVVYTTHMQTSAGAVPMLAREIRNLVGRAGRPGSSTKGLVLCANEKDWDVVTRIADGAPGERVEGALLNLITRLIRALAVNNTQLSNAILEANSQLLPLTDGIDATLIELLSDDLGVEEFRLIAAELASSTYAHRQADNQQRLALENVFSLRADRLAALRPSGRASWASGTGVRARLIDSIADALAPAFGGWQSVEDATDVQMLDTLLAWAWTQPDFAEALRDAYPDVELVGTEQLPPRADLLEQLRLWLNGNTFAEMSAVTSRDVDRLLRIHTGVISYALATLVEQAVAVLGQIFADVDGGLSPTVAALPDFIRNGVSTLRARELATSIRHRRAAHLLGQDSAMSAPENALSSARDIARTLLFEDTARWSDVLGPFVFARTVLDLGPSAPHSTST